MDTKELNPYLFSLIQMFASACWQQMGKIPSQIDGKISKDLKAAQQTIELLIMIKDKTKGNLSSTEDKMLTDTLSNLQMNYADEAAKEQTAEKPEEKKEELKN